MKIKVTGKVKGEIVISCLGGSLKRGDTLVLDPAKSAHSDVLWAIHHGYLEIIDSPVGDAPMGDVVCFVNCTNRTLTGKMFSKPLDPARSVVVKKSDFIFNDLMKMVDARKLKIHNTDNDQISTPVSDKPVLAQSDNKSTGKTRSSFSKKNKSNNVAQKKVENKTDIYANKEDKSSVKDKINSGINVVDLRDSASEITPANSVSGLNPTVISVKEPIFVNMNGEVS